MQDRKNSDVNTEQQQKKLEYPRFFKEFKQEHHAQCAKDLKSYLKQRGLLEPLLKAGAVDNIEDPIIYRRVMTALEKFADYNHISVEDPPPVLGGYKYPRFSKEFKPEHDAQYAKELKSYLKEQGLFEPLLKAGSVEDIKDPIIYRRVMNALQAFADYNHVCVEDPPVLGGFLRATK